MKKAVIFDNEGIIIKDDWDKVAQAFAKEFKLQPLSGDKFKQMLKNYDNSSDNPLNRWSRGEISKADYWSTVLGQYKIEPTEENIERASSKLELLTTEIGPESLELVRELKGAGYQVYMLTNATPEIHKGNRERHNYFDNFDEVFISFMSGARKPEPAAYQKLLEKTGLKPEECVFIDDKLENVLGAQKAGIEGVMYGLDQPIKNLKAYLREKGYKF